MILLVAPEVRTFKCTTSQGSHPEQISEWCKILKIAKLSFCEGYVEGKMHRQPFKPVGEICSTRKFQLVHSDVCGPMSTESIGGRKYLLHLLMITHDAVQSIAISSDINQKYWRKFKEFEAVTTVDSGQTTGILRTRPAPIMPA